MDEFSIHKFMEYFMYAMAIFSVIVAILYKAWWHITTPFIFLMMGRWYRQIHKQINEE